MFGCEIICCKLTGKDLNWVHRVGSNYKRDILSKMWEIFLLQPPLKRPCVEPPRSSSALSTPNPADKRESGAALELEASPGGVRGFPGGARGSPAEEDGPSAEGPRDETGVTTTTTTTNQVEEDEVAAMKANRVETDSAGVDEVASARSSRVEAVLAEADKKDEMGAETNRVGAVSAETGGAFGWEDDEAETIRKKLTCGERILLSVSFLTCQS